MPERLIHYAEYGVHLFKRTFIDGFFVKFLVSILLSVKLSLMPVFAFIALVFGMLVADLILGIIVALRHHKPIEVLKLGDSFIKFVAYIIGIIICHYFSKIMMPDVNVAYYAMFFVSATELYSIDKKIFSLTGTSMFGWVIARIKIISNSISFLNKKNKSDI